MNVEIVKADPRLRRLALFALLAIVIIGTIEILWFVPWLTALVQQRAAEGRSISLIVCISFVSIVALLGVPVMIVGARIARAGRSAIRLGRFPPPDMRVLRDTPVLTGRVAQLFGRVQTVLGILLVVCALALAVLGGYALLALT